MGRLTIIMIIFVMGTVAFAQDEPQPTPIVVTYDDVNAVAQQLYCPVCENEPLHTCGAPACVQWREEIREQLAAGRTSEQIVDYFVTNYGDRVVGIPQDDGLRLLSIAGPLVVLILGGLLGLLAIGRWRNTHPMRDVTQYPTTTEDESYRSQLEQDLRL
ncbi:MAG: hypothetical protein Kow00117_07390 [Phototrophicales bacterium]